MATNKKLNGFLTKEKIIELYFDKGLTFSDIASMCNCDTANIAHYFKKFGLKGRRSGFVAWNKGVESQFKKEKSPNWKGGKNKCSDCGLVLSNRVAKKCKSCAGKGKKGAVGWCKEKRYNWIVDRSLIKRQDERNNPEYKQWRLSVYKRDEYRCKISNQDCYGKIVAHHILSWREYPELRHDINNGVTLCHFHHPKKRDDEKRLSNLFSELIKN